MTNKEIFDRIVTYYPRKTGENFVVTEAQARRTILMQHLVDLMEFVLTLEMNLESKSAMRKLTFIFKKCNRCN